MIHTARIGIMSARNLNASLELLLESVRIFMERILSMTYCDILSRHVTFAPERIHSVNQIFCSPAFQSATTMDSLQASACDASIIPKKHSCRIGTPPGSCRCVSTR